MLLIGRFNVSFILWFKLFVWLVLDIFVFMLFENFLNLGLLGMYCMVLLSDFELYNVD